MKLIKAYEEVEGLRRTKKVCQSASGHKWLSSRDIAESVKIVSSRHHRVISCDDVINSVRTTKAW